MRPTSLAITVLALLCLLLPLGACSCEEEEPAGEPYMCGGMMAGATLCRTGQACIEHMGGMTGFTCCRDRGCPADVKALYCPTASGSVFCTEDQVFELVTPADGGPGTVMQTKVLCQF